VFCGIGICFDCLVIVNGRPNQRACLTEVHDGDAVEPQEGTGHDR
jgi:aerobic-type carbon monoxide dehydrogenase small subunit (CoxS/CutS family)